MLDSYDVDVIAVAQVGLDQVFAGQAGRYSNTHQADGIGQFDIIDDTVGNKVMSYALAHITLRKNDLISADLAEHFAVDCVDGLDHDYRHTHFL